MRSIMDKWRWMFGFRYELSADGRGLLKYFTPKDFYHVHSDELTRREKWTHRALKRLKNKVRFAI